MMGFLPLAFLVLCTSPALATDCDVGNYGENCEVPCSPHCEQKECNTTTGSCDGRCKVYDVTQDWWLGDRCDVLVPYVTFDQRDEIKLPKLDGSGFVVLEWRESADIGESAKPFIGYNIMYTTRGESDWHLGLSVPYGPTEGWQTGVITGLEAGHTYQFDISVYRQRAGQRATSPTTASEVWGELLLTIPNSVTIPNEVPAVGRTGGSPNIPIITGSPLAAILLLTLVIAVSILIVRRGRRNKLKATNPEGDPKNRPTNEPTDVPQDGPVDRVTSEYEEVGPPSSERAATTQDTQDVNEYEIARPKGAVYENDGMSAYTSLTEIGQAGPGPYENIELRH